MEPSRDSNQPNALPARLRPTVWAALHYVCWSLILALLYPVSLVIRGLERLREHE